MTTYSVAVLPGDGIGPEVIAQAVRVLEFVSSKSSTFSLNIHAHDFGGAAIDATGAPFPEQTRAACLEADAILLGAVGGPKWGVGPVRPEQGLLAIRKELDLYANVRPALFPSESLLAHSPLRAEVARGTEFIVIRELVKGLYYGDRQEADLSTPDAKGEAYDMMVYDKADVQRITRLAAYLALQQSPPAKIHSIDKANVLATSRLWRKVVTETIEAEFKDKGVEVDVHLWRGQVHAFPILADHLEDAALAIQIAADFALRHVGEPPVVETEDAAAETEFLEGEVAN